MPVDKSLFIGIAVGAIGFMIFQRIMLRIIVGKKINDEYRQEMNDVLTKDEYKVKGRFD